MAKKPTYEELELRIEEIERKAFGRKLSEEALQAPAGFLDVLVSSVSNGVIVYDDKFRYKLWNKFMENLTGIRAENVLGKSAFDLFPHLREEGIDKLLGRALGGETVQSDDTAYHVKDAGKFGWVTGLYSPHVDLSGNIIGVVAMIHDISDRKQAEDMLRESEERHRLLLEVSPDPIVVYNIEGETIYVNPAFEQTFGWSLDELRDKRIDFVPEENWPETKEAINLMLQGVRIQLFETRRLTKDGRILDIQLSSSLFFDRDEKPVGNIVILRDITIQKQAERTLRKAHDELELRVEERVKELNCLYGISKIRERPDIAFGEMLQEIVDLIPPSWQYPEITCARIIIEGQEYKTKNFKETVWKQASKIVVHGKRIGILEICYIEEKPESDEGPFLKEERSLISAIAGRLGRVTEHKQAEEALRKAHDELEKRVAERTRELKIEKSNLEEANIALQILSDKRQEDKKEIADNVLTNVKELVTPYFEKIKKTKLDDQQKTFLSIMESNLNEIISPFTRKMSLKYLNLTPTEIEVTNLIRYGSDSKEIADIMGLSPRTIYNHRKNIRKKFGLENRKTNLRSHLLSIY